MLWSWRRIALLTLGGIAVGVLSISIALFISQNSSDTSPTSSVPGVSFVVDPAILRDCDPLTVAKVSWNVAIPSIKRVDGFVLDKNAREKLFLEWREMVDSANTGAWVGAGTVFVLRDDDSKKQLAKFTVGSKSCN